MKKTNNPAKQPVQQVANKEKGDLQGYPLYPDNEDIYKKFRKEKRIDPENVSKLKDFEKKGIRNEKDFEEDVTGGDLDIPNVEVDDENEMIVIEDEENNYYSLGGDDHIDLEENLGT